MATPDRARTRSTRRRAGVVAVLAGAAVVAALGLAAGRAGPPAVGPAVQSAPAAAAASARAAPAAIPPAPAVASADLLTPAEWAALHAAHAGQPDGPAEIARILELLAFRRDARAVQAALAQGGPDESTRAIARRLDAGLAERVARREMTAPEALHLKAALLAVLQPDPAARAPELAAWRAALAERARSPADARDTRWRRERDALVAGWPAGVSPSAGQLDALQALRQRIYAGTSDSPPPPGDTP
ncbi:hypothetical protein [Ideonella sp.]|uniref:hypothetical protein n=1 Tax=Ideonella sp. TaxID=1929293 RepID=UPI0035B3B52D